MVIDNATNKVIQVGKPNFKFGIGSGDAPGAVMRPAPPSSTPGGGGGLGRPENILHPNPRDIEEE